MLKYFENEGLVELGRGSVTLLDAAKLEKLAKDSIR
jgi:CRP/FNR family transcriptional regulator